jgi:hypothetical protein
VHELAESARTNVVVAVNCRRRRQAAGPLQGAPTAAPTGAATESLPADPAVSPYGNTWYVTNAIRLLSGDQHGTLTVP